SLRCAAKVRGDTHAHGLFTGTRARRAQNGMSGVPEAASCRAPVDAPKRPLRPGDASHRTGLRLITVNLCKAPTQARRRERRSALMAHRGVAPCVTSQRARGCLRLGRLGRLASYVPASPVCSRWTSRRVLGLGLGDITDRPPASLSRRPLLKGTAGVVTVAAAALVGVVDDAWAHTAGRTRVAAGSSVGQARGASGKGSTARLFGELDDKIQHAMEKYAIPGVGLAVLANGQQHVRGF